VQQRKELAIARPGVGMLDVAMGLVVLHEPRLALDLCRAAWDAVPQLWTPTNDHEPTASCGVRLRLGS
jgi:hypothetical protein